MNGTNGSTIEGRVYWCAAGDAGLAEHAPHRAVMQLQLPRDRADRPAFGVMQPQDLGLELTRDHDRTPGSPPQPTYPLQGHSAQPRPRRQRRTTERAASERLAAWTARVAGSAGSHRCLPLR